MDIDDLRKHSAVLLGTVYRAEIGGAIADTKAKTVSIKGLSDATGIFYQRVQEEVQRLVGVGLLIPSEASGRTKEYVPASTSYWRACNTLLKELRAK